MTQPRHVALLCYLALARPRGLQPRDTLIALLWPEHDAAHGRQALRNALHGLRLRLGEAVLISGGDQLVGLNMGVVSCDAVDLERGAPWGHGAEPLAEDGVEPMQGLHVVRAAAFDHWLSSERGRLIGLLRRRSRDAPTPPPPGAAHVYSPDAWVMHARGHYLFLRTAHGGPTEDLLRCRDYFERARDLDPSFAPALAGLSNFYAVAARRGLLTPFHEHFAHAVSLAEQALAMDPGLAVPHVHFGVKALYLDDDFDRSGIEFATAVRKDPSYAEGHRFYGVWLGMAGRHGDAVREMEEAVALEPDVAHFLSSLGAARLAAGDRAGAEEALRRTLRLEPRHAAARERLIRLLEDEGRYEAAVEERERAPTPSDADTYRAALEAGVDAYLRLARESVLRDVADLEERVLSGDTETVDDIFSPPVVRLVRLYERLRDRKRARSWQLQAKARRPGLARWFEPLPPT